VWACTNWEWTKKFGMHMCETVCEIYEEWFYIWRQDMVSESEA